MRSWTVTGFGVKEESLCKASIENKIAFIKTFLPNIYEEMVNDSKKADASKTFEHCNSWIDNYEDDYCYKGFGSLFAQAVNNNENDFFVSCHQGEYSDENAVFFEDCQPWDMSERVKQMQPDDMREVFNKYLEVLQLQVSIERQSVEYYG